MTAEVRLTVISLSARSPDGADAAYLAWHGLDHLPEQYSIPSVVHGQRWVSTPACRAARAQGDGSLDDSDHAVQYLFSESAFPDFFALGAELRGAGRMPLRLPPVELAAYAFVDATSSLVRADVLPWRPCRGVYIVVSDAAVTLPEIDGVAGLWRYEGGAFHDRLVDTTGRHLTVCYLDGEPVETGERVTEALDQPVLLGAPFVTVVPFEWERSLP